VSLLDAVESVTGAGLGEPRLLLLAPLASALLVLGHFLLRRAAGLQVSLVNPLARWARGRFPRARGILALKLALAVVASLLASQPWVEYERVVEGEAGGEVSFEVPPRPGVVLVIDVSGSMAGEKLEEAKRALEEFMDGLNRSVDLGFIAFSDKVEDAVPPSSNWSVVRRTIEGLEAGGGTMYTYPLATAYSWLRVYRDFNLPAVLVFASDGMPGDPGEYKSVVDMLAEAGVVAYTVFIGSGRGAEEMRYIAERTGGRWFTAGEASEIPAVFREILEETNVAVKNVSVEYRYREVVEEKRPLTGELLVATVYLAALATLARHRLVRLSI
jgi:Mg-chelatase subunit ChlD